MRAIGSTIVGQFFDTTIFLAIAFGGILPMSLLTTIWITNFVFKILLEIILLPATYKTVTWLKVREAIDHFDHDTNFNPLAKGQ